MQPDYCPAGNLVCMHNYITRGVAGAALSDPLLLFRRPQNPELIELSLANHVSRPFAPGSFSNICFCPYQQAKLGFFENSNKVKTE
jgi:hypothetical protein